MTGLIKTTLLAGTFLFGTSLPGSMVYALTPAGNTATTTKKEVILQLEEPHGGWKVGGLTDRSQEYQSAYPFNLIDRGRIKGRSMIRGRFLRRDQARTAADKIVLNGAAMPLFSDEQGNFVRPYAFGRGSNSIEIRSSGSDRTTRRVQFYEAANDKAQARIRVVLSWDDHQAEVDMHVITPDGGHAFWADPILSNGAIIDPDGVDGPGPEIFTMAAPLHGPYQVWVNYWGNFSDSGYHFDEVTRQKPVMTATVTIITAENTPAEKQETYVVPLRKIGETTLVKSFQL